MRTAAGLRQKDLAARLDVSPKYLSMAENDKREPSLSFLRRFAQEVGVPVSVLLLHSEPDHYADPTSDAARLSADMRRLVLELADIRLRTRHADEEEAVPIASAQQKTES
jgi:transcriptional regulator with XRE-family HTH domain